MIIQCDSCQTKFRLDDSKVGANGVKVRCTKCHNVFVVMPPADEAAAEDFATVQSDDAENLMAKPSGDDSSSAQDAPEPEDAPAGGQKIGFDVSFKDEKQGEEKPAARPTGEADREMGAEFEDGTSADAKSEPKFSFDDVDFSFSVDRSEEAGPGAEAATQASEEEEDGEKAADMEKDSLGLGVTNEDFSTDGPFGGFVEDDRFEEDEEAASSTYNGFTLAEDPGDVEEGEDSSEGAPAETFEASEDEPAPKGGVEDDDDKPFEGLNFSFGDNDAADTGMQGERTGGDAWAGDEEEKLGAAPEDDSGTDEDDGFVFTPEKDTKAPGAGSTAADKVIPFTTASGKDTNTAADQSQEFARVFSRALEKDDVFSSEDDLADTGDAEFDYDDEDDDVTPARPSSARLGFVIAGLIVILGGGVLYFSGIIDTLTRSLMPASSVVAAAPVDVEAIKGFYVDNEKFGRFFVVEATIKNNTGEPQDVKGVRGVLYNSRGKQISYRNVSPGRVVSAEDLKTLTHDQLLARFRNPSGGTIPPRGTVPVMVPFTQVPPGTSEYGVDIIRP